MLNESLKSSIENIIFKNACSLIFWYDNFDMIYEYHPNVILQICNSLLNKTFNISTVLCHGRNESSLYLLESDMYPSQIRKDTSTIFELISRKIQISFLQITIDNEMGLFSIT